MGDGKNLSESSLRNIFQQVAQQKNFVIEDFEVSAGTGLAVDVSATSTKGKALIDGWYAESDADFTGETVTASTTNYVFLTVGVDGSGNANGLSITINTTGTLPANSILLAEADTDGSSVTAVRDGRIFPGFNGALATTNTETSIPNNTWTAIPLESTELYDTMNFHSTTVNNSRLTIPPGVNYVRLVGQLGIQGSSTTGRRRAQLYKNGVAVNDGSFAPNDESPQTGGTERLPIVTAPLSVSSGDYFELYGHQNSGSSLTVHQTYTWLGIEVVG